MNKIFAPKLIKKVNFKFLTLLFLASSLGFTYSPIELKISPPRQILHNNFNFHLVVENVSKEFDPHRIYFEYDDSNITNSVRKFASIQKLQNSIKFQINKLRLRPKLGQSLNIYLLNEARTKVLKHISLKEPHCHPFSYRKNSGIGDFEVEKELLDFVQNTSLENSINPNFILGLIAQESSFNPNAISWAKAVGLTQVTPAADQSIFQNSKNWPRKREIASKNFLQVKSMIQTGSLNKKNDWRLNPFYSVQGGILYIKWLKKYWSQKENSQLIQSLFGPNDFKKGQILLASYNSGAFRVKKELKKHGQKWLSSKNLRSAREYVAKVTSYCDSFSHEKNID